MGASCFPSVALADVGASALSWESTGDIIVTGTTGTAYGVYAGGTEQDSISITLNSDDTISISSQENYSSEIENYGIGATRSTNIITNNGTITVTTSVSAISKGAYAGGMEIGNSSSNGTNTLTNNGTITATATNRGMAFAYGMSAYGKTNTLTNYGTLSVTTESEANLSYAYGMYAFGSGSTSSFNNYGIIDVSATTGEGKTARAYQAYVGLGSANIGTWTLKLGETYGTGDTGYYVFGVASSQTLNFGPTTDADGNQTNAGATFIFYGVGDAYSNDKTYAVKDMVYAGGTVTGYIGDVQSTYEFLEVELVDEDGNAYESANPLWSEQYIKGTLAVTEDNSPTQSVANQTMSSMCANLNQVRNVVSGQTRTVGQNLGLGGKGFGKHGLGKQDGAKQDGAKQGGDGEAQATGTLYADAITTFTDAGTSYINPAQDASLWTAFAMPYYSQSGANNNSYDGHMAGIAMGATRQMSDDFSLGMHAAFSKGSGDSDLSDSDATAYTLGIHAVYNVGESLFFRGQLSGFTSESELDMVGSSEALTRANADMDTHGLYAMIGAGYDYVLASDGHGAPQHVLTPELGLSYFYAHMDGFDTNFYNTSTGASADSFGMKSEDYDVFYADATVRWTGFFDMSTGLLKPTVKVGIRQALSDPEVSSTMQFGNATATTYSDANETAFLCEAGLAWEVDGVDVSLTYSGEFGDEEYSHMGMFKVEWKF